jgi:hypothetical protein
MPRRRRIYILNIEDYLLEPPPPPSRAFRNVLRTALALLLLANLAVLVGLLFSLIPPTALEIAIAAVIAYTIILLLFLALSRSIHHAE